MKVLILNGNPQPERTAFEDYLKALYRHLHEAGHEAEVMKLREMSLNYCAGSTTNISAPSSRAAVTA